jgi:hypothetical protein
LPITVRSNLHPLAAVNARPFPARLLKPLDFNEFRTAVDILEGPSVFIRHLKLECCRRAGRFAVTDTIEEIGGAKPKTFEKFVREQQSELAARPVAARATA